jgi:predicted nucleic acid-binding protein
MAIVLFDSNILIDHLLGIRQATIELAGYDDAAISAICWIEATCLLTPEKIAVFDQDLADAGINILQTTPDIMRRAAELRGGHSLPTGAKRPRLPDCIIRASAESQGRVIVTRNPDDFGGLANPMVRVPYKLIDGVVTDVRPLPP